MIRMKFQSVKQSNFFVSDSWIKDTFISMLKFTGSKQISKTWGFFS